MSGFPRVSQPAHHRLNRSSEPAEYLEVGSRIEEDVAHYPDDDCQWVDDHGTWKIVHKDGSPY